MRFKIQGADKATGVEQAYTVDADSMAEAEDEARANGILIASVETVTPTLDYGTAGKPKAKEYQPNPDNLSAQIAITLGILFRAFLWVAAVSCVGGSSGRDPLPLVVGVLLAILSTLLSISSQLKRPGKE